MIDWYDPDYTSNGYFWNTVQSVKVSCAADSEVEQGSTGYMYSGNDSASAPVGLGVTWEAMRLMSDEQIVAVTNSSIMLSSAEGVVWTPGRTVMIGLIGVLAALGAAGSVLL